MVITLLNSYENDSDAPNILEAALYISDNDSQLLAAVI